MSLSDCSKCWSTPCECGWELRYRNIKYLIKQRDVFNSAIEFKIRNPNGKYSNFGEKETLDDIAFMKYINSGVV
jgi:hypothetical protein